MAWKRHTLLDISDAGRKAILEELVGNSCDDEQQRELLSQVLLPMKAGGRIPGIVRREEQAVRSGNIPVGFSSPGRSGAGRMRVAAFTRPEDVVRVTTPYELISLPLPRRTPCMEALAAAKLIAGTCNLLIGVWGSAALELYTDLPYTHHHSDLDLLVTVASREVLLRFLVEVCALEEHFGLRIDLELDLPNGYGVALKELLGSGRSVLGKSTDSVALLMRDEVFTCLPQQEQQVQ
jgi:phosphoribosyl-dephospho-CoA transferase